MESIPSNTIYVNNIDEKIKKNILKKLLAMIFSQYGKILQIVACKGLKLRGQAWIVFQDISSATNALRGKQGFNFYGKQLKIQYSSNKSDIISKREGNVISRDKRKRESNSGINASQSNLLNTTSNNILIAQNLPEQCNEEMLRILFSQCVGFVEVRVPPGRSDVAFIEFENEVQSNMAYKQLNGFQITTSDLLSLNFANGTSN